MELGIAPAQEATRFSIDARTMVTPLFTSPEEQHVAQIANSVIQRMSASPETLPGLAYLDRPEVRAEIARAVEAEYAQSRRSWMSPPRRWTWPISWQGRQSASASASIAVTTGDCVTDSPDLAGAGDHPLVVARRTPAR